MLKMVAASWMVSTACSITSGPMPSPGMTAMRFKVGPHWLTGNAGRWGRPHGIEPAKQLRQRGNDNVADCLDALAADLIEGVLFGMPIRIVRSIVKVDYIYGGNTDAEERQMVVGHCGLVTQKMFAISRLCRSAPYNVD